MPIVDLNNNFDILFYKSLISSIYFFDYYKYLMLPIRPQKKCISCNQFPLQSTINLKGGAIIDAECLQQIEALMHSFEDIEESMTEYYQHIISLVIRCDKCKNIIDGSKKMNVSSSQSSPICSDCKPIPSGKGIKKQDEAKTANCIDCNAMLSGFTLIAAINIDGLYLCSSCHTGHKNVEANFKEVEKVEVKKEKKEVYLPVKKNPPVNVKEFAHDPFSFGKPKKHIRSFSFQEKEQSFADLFSQPIKKQKVEQIKCEVCMKFYDASHFNSLNIGVSISICKQCSKKEIDDHQNFGLDCLFFETPNSKGIKEADIIPQLIQEKPQIKQLLLLPPTIPKLIPKVQQQPKPKASQPDKDTQYQLKQCKLCMNSESKMININCRHLMMCQKCYKEYKKKFKTQYIPCPFCSIPGKYQLYIQPIYI